MKNQKEPEYERFSQLTDDLLKVPHKDIKARIDTEKQSKKRKKSKVSSASHVVSDGD
jgi:hypothetical protein